MVRRSEIESSLASIRQARDTALARTAELSMHVSKCEEKISELSDKLDHLQREREGVQTREAALRAERDELHLKLLDLNGQKLSLLDKEKLAINRALSAEARVSELTKAHEESERKVAEIERQQERFKQEQKRSVATLAEQYASSQRSLDAASVKVRTLTALLEKQQTEFAELRRMQEEERINWEAQLLALRSSLRPTHEPSAREDRELARCEADNETRPPASNEHPRSGEIDELIASVIATIELMTDAPDASTLFDSLETNLNCLGQRAKQLGAVALQRQIWAQIEVARWLRRAPTKVIETIPMLLESAHLSRQLASVPPSEQPALDPVGALVYAVDDDVDNCECIAMALEKLQMRTNYNTTASIALGQLSVMPRDLVVLDVNMPGMNGVEFYEKLRANPHTASIPVVFVTGLSATDSRIQALPTDNCTYVAKPYNLTTLVLAVVTMLIRARLNGRAS